MPHFFINSALILVGVLGLFVMALMLFSYRSNIFVNFYLILIFTIGSLRNIIIGLFGVTSSNYFLNSKLITPIFLIVVPALFLYFKSLLKDYKQIHKKHVLHFVFPALNLGVNICQIYFNILDNQIVEN